MPEPLLDELDIPMFVYVYHGKNKVTGRYITGLFLAVGSTPMTWSLKCQTTVQTSIFGAKFTALKKAVKESILLSCHHISTEPKVYKPTPICVENMSVIFNATSSGSALNKKTVALSYHFVREHVANNVMEVRKVHTRQFCIPIHQTFGKQ